MVIICCGFNLNVPNMEIELPSILQIKQLNPKKDQTFSQGHKTYAGAENAGLTLPESHVHPLGAFLCCAVLKGQY